jgi:16S rRNA (cytosine967-C5)-methyltransferase
MLDRAASLVRDGGLLLFCTCSLEPEEGEDHVAPFLSRHPEFSLAPVGPTAVGGLNEVVTAAGVLRTLPFFASGDDAAPAGMDGFFAALFRRA